MQVGIIQFTKGLNRKKKAKLELRHPYSPALERGRGRVKDCPLPLFPTFSKVLQQNVDSVAGL